MKPFSWLCPFCNRNATITGGDFFSEKIVLGIDTKHGDVVTNIRYIVCPNSECKEFTLDASLHKWVNIPSVGRIVGDLIKKWDLIPSSKAKIFPKYIPEPILEDYEEACVIKNLSPKASATLARRCLQGMIRDFWKVKEDNLYKEIEAIKDKIEIDTWKAIDSVREIGNIGAHMEKDINLIIDVDPNEAELLINLIEILIKDWYITKHDRQEKLKALQELGRQKKSQRKTQKVVKKNTRK